MPIPQAAHYRSITLHYLIHIFTWRCDCCLLLLVFSDDDTPVQIPLQRVLSKQVAIQHQQNNAHTNVTNNLN